MSDWNDYLDLLLARDDLTAGEWRLAVGLARNLLGFRRRQDRIGERLLMESSGFGYRMNFVRARDGLVAKKLVEYEPGGKGRGHRSRWKLPLDDPPEKRAGESAEEKSAPQSAQTTEKRSEKRAGESARSKQGKNKTLLGPQERLDQTPKEASRARADDPDEEEMFDQFWDESPAAARGYTWEPKS